jgi:microcystin degradation protein MlrC
MRILIAGFQHETNTFALNKAGWDNFVKGEGFPAMQHGEKMFELAETNIPAGGFIQAASRDGHTLLPVIWTAASPSAQVTQEAYERICQQIIAQARELKPDAVYLDLHGAMVAEHHDDGEGELLRRMRETVGDHTPIIVSLDLHANVTNAMLHHATAMVAFRTYPHVDMAATGQKAYELLLNTANGPLIQESARIPFLIPINGMCTLMEPAKGIYHLLEELEKQPGVSSLSFAPGFPAADFPECGPVVWGYGSDEAVVERTVRMLRDTVCNAEPAWAVEFLSPQEAVAQAQKLALTATRPVIIADTQDNPGAGGSGDTTGILHALIAADANAALGLLLDPEAVKAAIAAGKGKPVTLALGGKSDAHGDPAVNDTFIVDEISEGKCRFDGPMMNGIAVDVGPVVTLRHRNVKVVVSSVKSQMLDRNLFRVGGITPEQESILVVKSSVHFRADFQPIASAILVAKSRGEMKADSQDLPWTRLHEGIRTAPLGKAFKMPC